MEESKVNKMELIEKHFVAFYKLQLICMLTGLLWSGIALFLLGSIYWSYLGGLFFLMPSIITNIRSGKIIPYRKKSHWIFLGTLFLLIVSIPVISILSMVFLKKWIGKIIITLLVIGFVSFWMKNKIFHWKKYIEENFVDERLNTIVKKSTVAALYAFFGLGVLANLLCWLIFPRFLPPIDKAYILLIFLNSFYVVLAVQSASFLFLYKKS